MDFTEYERNSGKRFTGLAFVVLLHILIVYALLTGLARKVVEVIKQPIETKIVEEAKAPPPKDLPPPPPKFAPPPPPFIPPPELQIQQAQVSQNTITALTGVKPEVPVMAPPHKVEPAVLRNPVRVAAVVDARACEKPAYPAKSLRNEETGTVTLAFLIGLDGRVVESKVDHSSGFKDLDRAAVAGLSLCKFKPGTVDGKPEQSWTKMQYVWKLE
jgi:protein TonB